MNLAAASEYHPHRRVHHAVRVHLWWPRDACAEPCVRPVRATLGLRDARAKAVACAWVDCLCARPLLLSTLGHLDAVVVDQSAIGKPVHLQSRHACDCRLSKYHSQKPESTRRTIFNRDSTLQLLFKYQVGTSTPVSEQEPRHMDTSQYRLNCQEADI